MVLFLYKSMTISLNFLQCPPRWTTLRVIISPGKNLLAALASIKYSTDRDHEKFYALDTPHMWDLLPMQHHVYKDPLQKAVRETLVRSQMPPAPSQQATNICQLCNNQGHYDYQCQFADDFMACTQKAFNQSRSYSHQDPNHGEWSHGDNDNNDPNGQPFQ